MVARQAHNLEVVGSSPSSATITRKLKDLRVQKTDSLLVFRLEEEYGEYSSSFFMSKDQVRLFLRKSLLNNGPLYLSEDRQSVHMHHCSETRILL